MLRELDAAAIADREVTAAQDSTAGRVGLLERTYRGPRTDGTRRLPYRRAAMSFMRWQASRGLLEPLDGPDPGSPWWRSVNEGLLRDGCEALAISEGADGSPSSLSVRFWLEFIGRPNAGRWYRAHNSSIVSAYLHNRDLAAAENEAERFFINVALLRVLYAHALVANPKLALGRFAPLGGLLGDPRLGMAGAFLSLGRVLPDRYPLDLSVEAYAADEHGLGRLLDHAVIGPKLTSLYEWSAAELREPGLRELIRQGLPAYEWNPDHREPWLPPSPPSGLAALLTRATR